MTLEALNRYPEEWAAETFGPMQAQAIAHLVTRYSQLQRVESRSLLMPTVFG